jgi:predicted transcriptional regulator
MDAIETTESPIDDIAFLARSDHRVDVLGELAERHRTRRELRESTGIIQPTLGRVLTGFEDRDWIRTDGSTYSLTPFGALLAEQFDELVDVVDTMRAFQDVSRWLPLDEMDIDLRRFGQARITTPSATDATAHLRREEELASNADSLRHLCSSSFPPSIHSYRDRIVEGGQRFEAVITADALDAAAAHSETAGWVRDIVGADSATVYRYNGPV